MKAFFIGAGAGAGAGAGVGAGAGEKNTRSQSKMDRLRNTIYRYCNLKFSDFLGQVLEGDISVLSTLDGEVK